MIIIFSHFVPNYQSHEKIIHHILIILSPFLTIFSGWLHWYAAWFITWASSKLMSAFLNKQLLCFVYVQLIWIDTFNRLVVSFDECKLILGQFEGVLNLFCFNEMDGSNLLNPLCFYMYFIYWLEIQSFGSNNKQREQAFCTRLCVKTSFFWGNVRFCHCFSWVLILVFITVAIHM